VQSAQRSGCTVARCIALHYARLSPWDANSAWSQVRRNSHAHRCAVWVLRARPQERRTCEDHVPVRHHLSPSSGRRKIGSLGKQTKSRWKLVRVDRQLFIPGQMTPRARLRWRGISTISSTSRAPCSANPVVAHPLSVEHHERSAGPVTPLIVPPSMYIGVAIVRSHVVQVEDGPQCSAGVPSRWGFPRSVRSGVRSNLRALSSRRNSRCAYNC